MKSILRTIYLYKRKKISKKRRKEASQKAFDFLLSLMESHLKILSFYPLKEEIDIHPFNEIAFMKKKLCLPKVNNGCLDIYHINNLNKVYKGSLQIHEPDPAFNQKISSNEISLILVPGIAFDHLNKRIGYGKAFYDKFLKNLKALKAGVGFKEQLAPFIPAESHDVKLDKILLF